MAPLGLRKSALMYIGGFDESLTEPGECGECDQAGTRWAKTLWVGCHSGVEDGGNWFRAAKGCVTRGCVYENFAFLIQPGDGSGYEGVGTLGCSAVSLATTRPIIQGMSC